MRGWRNEDARMKYQLPPRGWRDSLSKDTDDNRLGLGAAQKEWQQPADLWYARSNGVHQQRHGPHGAQLGINQKVWLEENPGLCVQLALN